MPGDDFPVFGHQHRIGESEAFDRRGDLLNLGLAVTPRVARVRPKRSDRYVLDRGTEFSHAKAPKSRDCRFFKICASGTTETDRCEIADQVGGMLTAVQQVAARLRLMIIAQRQAVGRHAARSPAPIYHSMFSLQDVLICC